MTRYPTRAAALAAINPAHKLPKPDWEVRWMPVFSWLDLFHCSVCKQYLAIHDKTTSRIQLTDAAHEAVCVPFGSGEG